MGLPPGMTPRTPEPFVIEFTFNLMIFNGIQSVLKYCISFQSFTLRKTHQGDASRPKVSFFPKTVSKGNPQKDDSHGPKTDFSKFMDFQSFFCLTVSLDGSRKASPTSNFRFNLSYILQIHKFTYLRDIKFFASFWATY